MTVAELRKDEPYVYQTIEQEIGNDYLRMVTHHLARASDHDREGNHHFARGSRLKAMKWMAKLECLLVEMNSPERQVAAMITRDISDPIANVLLNGDGTNRKSGLFS